MPGMIGGIGCIDRCRDLLKRFRSIWPEVAEQEFPDGLLAGHAFDPARALHRTRNGCHLAVDGELAIYCHAAGDADGDGSALLVLDDGIPQLTGLARGNVATMCLDGGTLHLVTEATGGFPLYYAEVDGGLLFSSHLRVLAQCLGSEPDLVGALQSVCVGYVAGGRTCFRGIRQVLPGQAVTFTLASRRLTINETTRAWTQELHQPWEETVARTEMLLRQAVRRCCPPEKRYAIMMSAGWDSRLVLGAMLAELGPDNLVCYTHGDRTSRELQLTQMIARRRCIECYVEGMPQDFFQPQELSRDFDRTEQLEWFYWHRAGRILAAKGVDVVVSGIFGEILGGQYGVLMAMKELAAGKQNVMKQVSSIGLALLRLHRLLPDGAGGSEIGLGDLERLFKFRSLKNISFAESLQIANHGAIEDEINHDVTMHLRRIQSRGSATLDQVVEAYITETRCAQRMAGQPRSCRTATNIVNFLGDQDVLQLCSWVPYSLKLQNALSQAVLARLDPALLSYPTGATLVPARLPIIVQEVSRLLRRKCDDLVGAWSERTRGRLRLRPTRYITFDFLRDGKVLDRLIDDLRSELFDKKALRHLVQRIRTGEHGDDLNNVCKEFMRIYSVDLMLR